MRTTLFSPAGSIAIWSSLVMSPWRCTSSEDFHFSASCSTSFAALDMVEARLGRLWKPRADSNVGVGKEQDDRKRLVLADSHHRLLNSSAYRLNADHILYCLKLRLVAQAFGGTLSIKGNAGSRHCCCSADRQEFDGQGSKRLFSLCAGRRQGKHAVVSCQVQGHNAEKASV